MYAGPDQGWMACPVIFGSPRPTYPPVVLIGDASLRRPHLLDPTSCYSLSLSLSDWRAGAVWLALRLGSRADVLWLCRRAQVDAQHHLEFISLELESCHQLDMKAAAESSAR